MSDWSFILCSPDGTPLQELTDSRSRTVGLRLDKITTGSFLVDTFNSCSNLVRQLDQTFIKAYRGNLLIGAGPLVPNYNKTVSPQSKTIQVNWGGIGWRLSRRILPLSKTATGVLYPATLGSTSPCGVIAGSFFNELNHEAVWAGVSPTVVDTGIRVGSTGSTVPTQVGPWSFKNALQAISDLSAPVNGYDWEIAPTEPISDSLGTQWGTFNCDQAFGITRPNVAWEYGDGKHNVASFTEVGDFSGALNQAFAVDQTVASGSNILEYHDITAIKGSGVLYNDVVSSDLVTDVMRLALLQKHVAVRKIPKMVITFQPIPDLGDGTVYQFGVDYNLGDIFTFRAVEFGQETINGLFRCYGVDFVIDDNGVETATPILVSEDSGA